MNRGLKKAQPLSHLGEWLCQYYCVYFLINLDTITSSDSVVIVMK
jgi:hypothetical protein